jgi:hypothetical protein
MAQKTRRVESADRNPRLKFAGIWRLHSGRSLHKAFESMILRILTAVLLALACAGCGSTLEGSPPSPAGEETVVPPAAPAVQEMRDLTPTEKNMLADGFSSGFDNPEAARFRWAKILKISTGAVGSFEYCGMINVKNAHGGYDGWQPFLATITTARGAITGGTIAAINAGNKPENRDVLPKLCRQKGFDPGALN